jgi:serine acetyltransferase
MAKLLEELRLDLAWTLYPKTKVLEPPSWGWARVLFQAIKDVGFRTVFLYRVMRRLHLRGHRILPNLIQRVIYHACHAFIAPTCDVKPGAHWPHPYGMGIGVGVELGPWVTVNQHSQIGGNFGRGDQPGRLSPKIERGAWICSGAFVGGGIIIGEGSIVGANSVVTHSVPAMTIVRGNPATVVRPVKPDEFPWITKAMQEESSPGDPPTAPQDDEPG